MAHSGGTPAAASGTLRQFFHAQNCHSEERIRERLEAIYQATPATLDPAVLEGFGMIAQGLVALLHTLRGQIEAGNR